MIKDIIVLVIVVIVAVILSFTKNFIESKFRRKKGEKILNETLQTFLDENCK